MIPVVIGDMRAMHDVFVAFIVRCAHEGCGESTSSKTQCGDGSRLPEFYLPEGWHSLDGKAYCSKHSFQILTLDSHGGSISTVSR